VGLSLVFQISKSGILILAHFFKFKNLLAKLKNWAQFHIHTTYSSKLESVHIHNFYLFLAQKSKTFVQDFFLKFKFKKEKEKEV